MFCFAEKKMKNCYCLNFFLLLSALPLLFSCSKQMKETGHVQAPALLEPSDIVNILSSAVSDPRQMQEVYDAVSESVENGYDEEYTLADLFETPGSGVGRKRLDPGVKASLAARTYERPLRDIFTEHFNSLAKATLTKASVPVTAQDYLDYISRSDMQIYWPGSASWDGESLPVITFDPDNGSEKNIGYCLDENGELVTLEVTEKMCMERPVWVINTNDDAGHVSLDVLRKNNPQWGSGGSIVVNPSANGGTKAAEDPGVRSLVLKDLTLKRNYDTWFQGASEIFCKIGAVESFKAQNESDIYLYNPSITDFMVVVRRYQVGKPLELNTLLVSDWTTQLQNCAFMIIEDDGGNVTSWNCSAVVKYNSKSYGFEISLPYRERDDIVWRGQLSRKYIEASDDVTGNFGDVQLTFSLSGR